MEPRCPVPSSALLLSNARIARLLIVDDDPVLLEALTETLTLRLFRIMVDTCEAAEEALARLQRGECYDLILTDVRMKAMDGLALLEAIRPLCPDTPAIVMTAHGDEHLVRQAQQCGAAAVLLKPIDRHELVALLKQLLRSRHSTIPAA